MRIFSSKGFPPERLTLEATLFYAANGYLGVRANSEKGKPALLDSRCLLIGVDGDRLSA